MHGRRILITGVGGFWGGELARRLESDPQVEQIVGIGLDEPPSHLVRTDFVRADLRHDLIGRLIRGLGVDTVVHADLLVDPRRADVRQVHETNVIGTLNLLAACRGRDSPVQHLVVKSSTAGYGCHFDDPSFWTEDMRRRTPPEDAFARDIEEVESEVREAAAAQPAMTVTVLRYTNVLGPRHDSPFRSLFSLPMIPCVLGFDPRLQFLHEDDGVDVLLRATRGHHPGVFNVSGPGVVVLSQAARILGRPLLPVIPPFGAGLATGVMRRFGLFDWPPHLLRMLMYGKAVDITRLTDVMGVQPRSSLQVVRDMAERAGTPSPEAAMPSTEAGIEAFLRDKARTHRH